MASSAVFPSMKARQLLAVLTRPPLRYRVVRQVGSHRRLESHKPEGWWADSDDLPGFTAAGATFDEVRELAHSGAECYLERPVEVEDRLPRSDLGAGGSS